MNNAILFYFNISVYEIKKINTNYYFTYLNNDYGIYFYNRDVRDVSFLYNLNLDMINKGLIGYEMILTNKGDVLFNYEGLSYILMRIPKIKNRVITYEDVIGFYFSFDNNYAVLDKSDWSGNWSKKIDFINYQFDQMFNKFPAINESIDYFVGMWENGISYFNDNVDFYEMKVVCHKRVCVDMDLLDFLNPLNFVIDYKERDIGEYLKSFVMSNNYTFEILDKFFEGFTRNSMILLISRVLFPSYYFDLYEDIVLGETTEDKINDVILKRDNVIKFLKYMFERFSVFNIPYIEWIKKSD